MVEILASVLTGAGLLSQVVSWNLDLEAKNNVGHAFIAVDLAQMLRWTNLKCVWSRW